MKRFKYILEYIILFALNGLMLWFFRGYLNLVIAVCMVVFLLYALISVHIVKERLSLHIEVPAEPMVKNTEFLVRLRLENRCILPLVKCHVHLLAGNAFLGDVKEMCVTMPVKPLETTLVELPFQSQFAGNIVITGTRLVLDDLLSFHSVSREISVTDNVYILLVGGDGEEFLLNDYEKGMDEVEESKITGSDFSDVSQVREYIPGDAMKNIHWKLSAKRDVLMVKERLHMSSRKLLLVLALEKANAEKVDETVETLYRFGIFFIGSRVPVTLFWWSDKYREIRQETAESEEEWRQIMIHVFHTQAGDGFVEEHFQRIYPGKGYIRIAQDGVHILE